MKKPPKSDEMKELEKRITELEKENLKVKDQIANLKLDIKKENIKTEQCRAKLNKESAKLERQKLNCQKKIDALKSENAKLKKPQKFGSVIVKNFQ